MIRTQIQITEEQDRRLRAVAEAEGISLAETIRRCIEAALDERVVDRRRLYRRAAEIAGRFEDREGRDDVASRHDEYLDEAFR